MPRRRCIALVSKLTESFDLGDIVMSNAVVRYVRLRFPDSRIVLIARADEIARYQQRFYARHSWIDDYLACPIDRSWTRWVRFYLALRALRPDLCIANIQSLPAWFMFLAGIPRRMGIRPANRWLARFLTDPITVPGDGATPFHWTDVASAYMTALDGGRRVTVQDLVPFVRYVEEPLELAASGLRRPLVVMHMGGATHWNRRWPPEGYLQIAVLLSTVFGASIALAAGADEKKDVRWLMDRLTQACPEARVQEFAGASLNRLLNLYTQADLYLGNDSGLMHLAVAVGLPVVAVFGPSDHLYGGPDKVDARHQVVRRGAPCSLGDCPIGCNPYFDPAAPDYPVCLKQLDVATVWAAVTRSLCARSSTFTKGNACGTRHKPRTATA